MPRHKFKEMDRAYGFDEVALAPGDITINPDQTDIGFAIGPHTLSIPILASAMDAIVDPAFAVRLGEMGGLAVLNLEGVQTRYENAGEILARIAGTPEKEVTSLMQKVYSEPINDSLVSRRIREIKEGGAICAVSVTPANTKRLAPIARDAGMDILVVQSTVTTARHISKSYRGLILPELCQQMSLPIIVGNCCTYSAALDLMRTGIDGILVGVGPGAACTTREVIGVGVPQITATLECSAARDAYLEGERQVCVGDNGRRNPYRG